MDISMLIPLVGFQIPLIVLQFMYLPKLKIYVFQLRSLVQQLNIRCGLKPVLQNHHHNISSQSLENFWRHWLEQFNPKSKPIAKDETTDTLLTGSNIVQENLIQDVYIRKTSRYRWGTAGASVDNVECDDNRPEHPTQMFVDFVFWRFEMVFEGNLRLQWSFILEIRGSLA